MADGLMIRYGQPTHQRHSARFSSRLFGGDESYTHFEHALPGQADTCEFGIGECHPWDDVVVKRLRPWVKHMEHA